ncbi:tetratricopeptide repeat protein [Candidatus Sumerlaeota bacterium]|nr:tetratricopeptide repeat protein [Candidatus Sumerlaeota bacterium]
MSSAASPVLERSVAIALVAWVAALACFGLDNNDTWWHLASGRFVWESGALPTHDPFSHLLGGKPWADEYWVFQLALLALWHLGAAPALTLFKVAWMSALFGGMGWALRRRGVAWGIFALASAPALVIMGDRVTVRPELITWAAMAAFLLLLPRGTAPPRRAALISLPLIQVLWTNCHPAFLLGPVIVSMTAFAQGLNCLWRGEHRALLPLVKAHSALLASVLLASLVNPYGYRLHLLPFELTETDAFLRHILEWQSPAQARNLFLRHVVVIFAVPALLGLLLTLPRREAIHWIWFAAFALLGMQAARHSALFALVSLVVIAETWGTWWDGRSARWPRSDAALQAGALTLLIALLLLTLTGWLWQTWGTYRRLAVHPFAWRFPAGEAGFVAEEAPEGHGFNDYNIGGYLLWRLFPGYQVAIDGRLIVYGGDLLDESQALVNGQADWRTFFGEHDIHWALLSSEAETLIQALWEAPDWHLVFVGLRGVVFVDEALGNRSIVERSAMGAEDLEPLAQITPLPRGPLWMAPPTPYVAVRRAKLLLILGRADLASAVVETQIAQLPDDRQLRRIRPFHLLRAGGEHMRRGHWEEAEAALRTLVEIEPENLNGWNNLGVLFARTQRPDEARAAWERALAIDPHNPAVQENLRRLDPEPSDPP